MTVTTLQAAALRGVTPSTIHQWIARGKIKPVGKESQPDKRKSQLLFDRDEVLAVEDKPMGRLAQRPAPPNPEPLNTLPPGLRMLQKLGRFKTPTKTVRNQHTSWEEPIPQQSVGGGVLLGHVLIGADWLRVYRHFDTGVIYHELADFMREDADWMESRDHAETAVLLGYTKEAA